MKIDMIGFYTVCLDALNLTLFDQMFIIQSVKDARWCSLQSFINLQDNSSDLFMLIMSSECVER